ncbi:long-chain acyl-CoA synthetases & [Dactylonectria estremocensis]|uniref:Long-chain acyl-CoA synthetases n=1 Tax=Dactylonectria estremocensis TaxID=1079267 RepID=A0A9P9DXB6_9HYPO|nr:long-chain acyl-CoA synthetases & [Dactylonectria estremocensis]
MAYISGVVPMHQVQKPPFTIEAPGYEKIPGETVPRRHPRAKDGLIDRPSEDVYTVFDIVRRSARLYADKKAVGWRRLIKLHKETKTVQKNIDGRVQDVEKEWQLFELSDFSYLSYKEYETLVLQLGAGLRKLGLTPEQKLHLFAATSHNWIAISHSCASQSISIVTAYDTLGETGVEHSLHQTQSTAIYIDPHLLKTAMGPLKRSNVKTVIINDKYIFATGGEVEEFRKANPEFVVVTLEQLRKLGEENMVDPVPAKPNDIYCIMYTSGTTGPPKGAVVTHESFIAGVTGLYTCIDEVVTDNDSLLAYLPLAHILEMAIENLGMFIGGTIGYGTTRTLSDLSVRNCAGDMRELKPTMMVGVPQVWETVKKGVIAKVAASNPLVRTLFWGAFYYKDFMVRYHLPGANIFDSMVFGKVREQAGGRVRMTVNGASSIADGTKNFLSMVMAPMILGYGLTETSATGMLGSPLQYTPDYIGTVQPAIEVKLVSVPELGYFTDTDNPQGEIWIRGKPVMLGYYNDPEETNKVITPDRWFKTGDIGELNDNGHMRVIDRLKNLVKMQGGEYISLEKVESIYRGAQTVSNVMVYADPEKSRPIAVVMPNEKALTVLAEELGVEVHNLYLDVRIRDAVLRDLQATAKHAGLASLETVSGVVITEQEWTPPTGLVTATHKLNRRAIQEAFREKIVEVLKTSP